MHSKMLAALISLLTLVVGCQPFDQKSEDTSQLQSIFSLNRLYDLQGHNALVQEMAYSPDGQRLLSVDASGQIIAWKATSDQRLWSLSEPNQKFRRIIFSKDGKLAVVAGQGFVGIIDPVSGQWIHQYPQSPNLVFLAVAISHDNQLIALGDSNAQIQLLDVNSGQLSFFSTHEWPLQDIKFMDNDQFLLAGDPSSIILWNVDTHREVRRLVDSANGDIPDLFWLSRLGFSSDGSSVIASSGNDAVLFDLTTQQVTQRFTHHTDEIVALSLTHDMKYAITSGRDHATIFWNVDTGAIETTSLAIDISFGGMIAVAPQNDRFAMSALEIDIFGGAFRPKFGIWAISRN